MVEKIFEIFELNITIKWYEQNIQTPRGLFLQKDNFIKCRSDGE